MGNIVSGRAVLERWDGTNNMTQINFTSEIFEISRFFNDLNNVKFVFVCDHGYILHCDSVMDVGDLVINNRNTFIVKYF